MYKIVTILNLIFALCVCEQLIGQIKPDFIIDENIKEEVERNISDSLCKSSNESGPMRSKVKLQIE